MSQLTSVKRRLKALGRDRMGYVDVGKAARREYQNVTAEALRPHGYEGERRVHQALCLACDRYGLAQPGHVVGRRFGFGNSRPEHDGVIYLHSVPVRKYYISPSLWDALEQDGWELE